MAEEDYWAAAVEFADSAGVDIINSSLGYHRFDDATQNYRYCDLDGNTAMISRTASMLARKGIILVNSAGNDGLGTWKKINVPADARDIITVGAVSANGDNAAFSAIGPTTDGRVKPDVMAMGSPTSVITGRGSISKDIGTSFSAPLVAGMIACLWQAFPDKTALQIIEMVRKGGNRADCPDNILGYGIPDFWNIYHQETRKEEHKE
jgi:subtilisin family serine protease